jgi:hypothetical protein
VCSGPTLPAPETYGGLYRHPGKPCFGCEPPPFLPEAPTSSVADEIANGELPADIVAAADACPGGSDEGRWMLQLIQDVAPGAAQAFDTAFNSRFDFACCIMELGGIDTAHPPGSDRRKLLKIRKQPVVSGVHRP